MTTMTEAAGQRTAMARPEVNGRSAEQVVKNLALFLAAPFIGLAYIIAFPFVGTAALLNALVSIKS